MFAGVQWLLNGMEVENLDHSNVLTVFFSTIGSGVLLIVNVSLSFNMTMVQCIALLNSGAMVPSTIAKILLVQSGGKSCSSEWEVFIQFPSLGAHLLSLTVSELAFMMIIYYVVVAKTFEKGQFGGECHKLLEACKVYMSH
jgi:hypothetical protein